MSVATVITEGFGGYDVAPPLPIPAPSGGGAGVFFVPQIGEKKKKRHKNDDNLLLMIATIISLLDDYDEW